MYINNTLDSLEHNHQTCEFLSNKNHKLPATTTNLLRNL